MSHEMVRVRVLFLEPGNLLHPSDLDSGITQHCIDQDQMVYGEDYADFNIFKINSAELADSIVRLDCAGSALTSLNDPCVEMLVPMVVVYVDIMHVNSDWHGGNGGGVGWTLNEIGILETFGQDFETLVAHAKTLRGKARAHKDEWGEKVQFFAMYDYCDWRDYWGEWDCEHSLVGFFEVGDIPVRKFGEAQKPEPDNPVEEFTVL